MKCNFILISINSYIYFFSITLAFKKNISMLQVKKIIKANIRGMYIGKVSIGGIESSEDEGKTTFFIGCIQVFHFFKKKINL